MTELLERLKVISIKEALTVFSEKGRYLEIKERHYYGLSFCRSGEIVYTHNGKRIVSEPGVAVLLPCGENYVLEGSRTGEFPLINFSCSDTPIREFLRIPLRNEAEYLRDYELLKEQMLLGRSRLHTMELLYGMLHRLSEEGRAEGDALTQILSYLEEHYADAQLSNTVLAEQGGISEVYMRQLFRRSLHTSPKQYILELRIRKAKRMLCETSLSVGEIAKACGFAAIYHFSGVFHTLTGATPTAYRRRNRRIFI